jgi:protein-tyrosine phosphatase
LNEKAVAQFAYVLSAREEFLMTALGCIQEQYGSTDRWLEAEYQLDAKQREALQARYLE